VSGGEPALVSPEMSMMIAPTFHCRVKTLGGFGNVKTYFFSLYSTTLRQRTTSFFSHPEHCSHHCSLKLENTTFLSQQLPLGLKPRDGNAKEMFYWTVADK